MRVNKTQGFTLPELLTAVAIAAILLAVASPNLKSFMAKDRIASSMNELVASLQLARSEAVKRMTPVTVCVSSNGTSCVGNSSQAWEAGWIVFVGTSSSLQEVLRVSEALPTGYTARSNSKIGDYVTYLANGRGQTSNTSNTGGQLVFCSNTDTSTLHAVLVAVSGRIYSAKDTNGDGIMDDGLGNKLLTCTP